MKKLLRLALLAILMVPLGASAQVYYPYTIDFEDDTSGWQFVTTSSSSPTRWLIDTAANNTRGISDSVGHALYVSSDDGATVSYQTGSSHVCYAVKTITFAEAGDYTIAFDWMAGGEDRYDMLHAYLAPADATLPTSTYSFSRPSSWEIVAESLSLSTGWQSVAHVFTVVANTTYKLVFVWRNDSSGGTGQGAAVDNIVINQFSCPAPFGLTFDEASLSSLTFHWTAGGSESAWQIMVDDSLADIVYDTFATVGGLNHSAAYSVKVRGICGAGDTSFWSEPLGMFTECYAITDLPWSTDFEQELPYTLPLCWSRPYVFNYYYSWSGESRAYPSVRNYSSYAHSGSNSLQLYYYPYNDADGGETNTSMTVSPFFEHTPTDLHIQFFARCNLSRTGSVFQAGVMTDPADTSTFIPLLTVEPGDDANNSMQEVNLYTENLGFDNLPEGLHVAFLLKSGTGSVYTEDNVYIDDLVVSAMPTCRVPVAGTIDSVSYEAVALSWTVSLEADEYDVMLIATDGENADTTHHQATELGTLVAGLAANTGYEAYVAAICGTDTTAYRYIGAFVTDRLCYPPQNLRVSAITANAAAIAWDWLDRGQERTSFEVVLVDETDPAVAPQTFPVSGSFYTFTGLDLGHSYLATFYTVCGAGDSASVSSIRFMPHHPACAEFVSSASSRTDSYSLPIYTYYANSLSQTLYPDSLVAGIDSLNGIAYNATFRGDMSPCDFNVDVYIGRRTGLYPYGYSQTPLRPSDSTMRKVVDGYQFSVSSNGWVFIPFDTNYAVGNTSDSTYLVVTVVNRSATAPRPYNYWFGQSLGGYSDNFYQSLYQYDYSGSNPINPETCSASGSTFVPDIQFFGTCASGGCTAPSVQVVASDTSSVSLNWLPGGSESSWLVEYSLAGNAPVWTRFTASTTDANITVSGLMSGTDYLFRVASLCGDDTVYSTSVAGTTQCLTISVPTTVSFVGINRLPNCWSTIGTGVSPHVADGYAFYNGSSIVSPAVSGDVSGMMARITTRSYSQNNSFRVGVCDADGGNVTWIATVPTVYWYDNSEFGVANVYFNMYAGTGRHIIFAAPNNYSYVYLQSVEFLPLPSCVPVVSDVVLESSSSTSATLSWISSASDFEVQYRLRGDTVSAWSSVIVADTVATLTGLTPGSHYNGRLRAICGVGDSSEWKTFDFFSDCVPVTTTFYEDFAFAVRGHELPLCWSSVGNSAVRSNGTSWATSSTYSGDYLYSVTYGSNSPADDWLITPEITVPTGIDSISLVYDVATNPYYDASSEIFYEVRLSATGADTASFSTLLFTDTASTSNRYETRRVSLAGYEGQTVRFAFRNRSRYYGYVYLDNVGIRSTVDPVYQIFGNTVAFVGDTTLLRAVRQQGATTGMTLAWTSSMAAAGQATLSGAGTDSASIVYSATGVDTIVFIATNAFGADTSSLLVQVFHCSTVSEFPFTESFESGVIPCWTLVYADGNPSVNTMGVLDSTNLPYSITSVHDGNRFFRFSSYTETTPYDQYLISPEIAGAGREISFHYAMYDDTDSLQFGYSTTTNDTGAFTWVEWLPNADDWTERSFALPDSVKYVAFHYWGNYRWYAYLDAISITASSSPAPCEAPTLTLDTVDQTQAVVAVNGTASSYEAAAVTGEWVAPASGQPFSGTSYTFSGLIPGTDYLLAVRAVCDEGRYSDWVWLAVTTAAHPCVVPSSVSVSSVSFDGAVVAWTPGSDEAAWEINVTGPSYDQTFTSTATSFTIDGLASGETFSVRVRSACGTNIYSDWSESVQFTTERCQPVSGITATASTFDSATVSWNPAGNGSGNYEVEYGLAGFRQGDGTRLTVFGATSCTLTGLESEVSYDVYVRTVCAVGLHSEWSAVTTFTTPQGVGVGDVDVSAISLYPNPARTSVSIHGLEPGAKVTVVDLNGREVVSLLSSHSSLTLDVSGLPQGAYFVRIAGMRQTAVRKLVVK